MGLILVAGLINIETTLKVDNFPIEYAAIEFPFYGINTSVSGVAVNIPKALKVLGENVKIVSLLGNDQEADYAESVLKEEGFGIEFLKRSLKNTPQSIVINDKTGRRKIYCDLKDYQDAVFEQAKLEEALSDCKIAIVCNSNFSRPLLRLSKDKGVTIATDVHVLSDIHDSYNKDFMDYADILFLSHENIPYEACYFLKDLKNEYNNSIIVLGMGSHGALIYIRKENAIYYMKSVFTREVVNTVGAGDALFSCFIHYHSKGYEPLEALKRAQVFASYKIGANGAANGFIDEGKVEELYRNIVFDYHKVDC